MVEKLTDAALRVNDIMIRLLKLYRLRCYDSIVRHGLVICTTCSRLWNRDTDAASNIWKVTVEGLEARSVVLRR